MIEVIHPGIHISIQDRGRFSYVKKGVPLSGYMDSFSAELGNSLLRNRPNAAVLEITFGQGKLKFLVDTYICLTGGNFSPLINDSLIEMNTVKSVKKGDVLLFNGRQYGARTYLAVREGIQSENVLLSQSFCPGITEPRMKKGEEVAIETSTGLDSEGFAKVKVHTEHFNSDILECYPGPEYEQLTKKQKERLAQSFTISEDNNRVGYRLNELVENELSSILTSAVLPGTVQLTPSGKLIVLMRDCQVTGGYPRVLQLSEYAISRLSQKVAGDTIQFQLD